MSVLIKGMEIPQSCDDCKLRNGMGKDDGKVIYHCAPLEKWVMPNPLGKTDLTTDCPLVPVPPHGRLIDVDTLKVRHGWLDNFDNTHTHIQFVYANEIYSTPTIIESEKEVKDG